LFIPNLFILTVLKESKSPMKAKTPSKKTPEPEPVAVMSSQMSDLTVEEGNADEEDGDDDEEDDDNADEADCFSAQEGVDADNTVAGGGGIAGGGGVASNNKKVRIFTPAEELRLKIIQETQDVLKKLVSNIEDNNIDPIPREQMITIAVNTFQIYLYFIINIILLFLL